MPRFNPSIRWRLATISAALTFAILLVFAVAIGQLTTSQVRSNFDNELAAKVAKLADDISVEHLNAAAGRYRLNALDLETFAGSPDVAIRIIGPYAQVLDQTPRNAPDFPVYGLPGSTQIGDYRVETRVRSYVPGNLANTGTTTTAPPNVTLVVQYARRSSDLDATIHRVRLFLILGVLAGTAFALGGGLLLARRAMTPIARLTDTARDIARTRDPNREIPAPETEDEIGELATTLDDMLKSLSASRAETEEMLRRQRRFVADASHELRTPLTSVLANLELLEAELDGERGEAARSALRSSQRMRRLISNLLLLARADAKREITREPADLGKVLLHVAVELGPMMEGHDLEIDAKEAIVDGNRDDLHRMVLNLVENAVRHTPPGTHVRATSRVVDGHVEVSVADDGPGLPEQVRDRLFERFVRAGDDSGGSSFGLGLSIVKAVAEAHGGSVAVQEPLLGGVRFVVTLPAATPTPVASAEAAEAPEGSAPVAT